VLDSEGNTKLSAGIGLLYDATNLVLIARPSAGERLDFFRDQKGNPIGMPIPTTFTVNKTALQSPRVLNWSAAIEKKLPKAIYLKAEFIQRHGIHDFVYNVPSGAPAGDFLLQNTRTNQYDALRFELRHTFTKNYSAMVSYTRSRSRSNQVLDFNVDNPVFSPQAAGPYSWDTPNRALSWGFLPFFNSQQALQGQPGAYRFPAYFSLNVHLEKRFRLFGANWAVRGGLDNITGRHNPFFVNNNIDSPQFRTFSDFTTRAFTTRIRFLGRK
jgi:hypothetical protein